MATTLTACAVLPINGSTWWYVGARCVAFGMELGDSYTGSLLVTCCSWGKTCFIL